MLKHTRNIDPLERPGKRAKIQPIPRVVTAAKKTPQSRAKQVQVLTDTSPHRTASAKGKEKAITPPLVSLKKKKRPTDDSNTPLPTSFKVVAGSYEKLLYGLDGTVTVDDQSNLQFHLKPIFIFPAHVSCIKSVAASPHGGKWLATGSADEIVKVWDLKRRKEIGGLMHHEGQHLTMFRGLVCDINIIKKGSITHLTFLSRSHLLSASEDGTLCLFRARDWAVLRVLKGHKGRVNSVAVHPSGKVALSVGKDGALRMWDLMRGKGCASTKIGKG
jgi:protein MAK11